MDDTVKVLYEAASKGFHTSETCGPEKRYLHKISFQSIEELHAYEDAWLKAMLSVRDAAAPRAPEAGAAAPLLGMFRALVDAGGPETIARHGVERGSDAWKQAIRAGMLEIERRCHPERFDEPRTQQPEAGELPEPARIAVEWFDADRRIVNFYTADQMRAYAQAAVNAALGVRNG